MIGHVMPKDWGDGWIGRTAADFARAAIWAGFDAADLTRRLARAGRPGRVLNIRTVERVLGEMQREGGAR